MSSARSSRRRVLVDPRRRGSAEASDRPNGDGARDESEFEEGQAFHMIAFAPADVNGKARFEADEFANALAASGIMDEVSSDGDGRVSRQEFAGFMGKRGQRSRGKRR